MRIIGGQWRRRRLAAVPPGIRPTSDRLRESLFNVIGESCRGARWVDACAGSGAVGLEALSRGAAHVDFVESAPAAARLIQKNIALCGALPQSCAVLKQDVDSMLRGFEGPAADVVFFDPPYDYRDYPGLLERLLDSRLWDHSSVVIVEHFKKTVIEPLPAGLEVTRRLTAGDNCLLFLTWCGAADPEEHR